MQTQAQPQTPTQASTQTHGPVRRRVPVGRAVLVMVIALLIGSLLNAPGIRKTALGQPVGVRRDVARFFAEPLYDVSHALGFDRLREAIQDVVGRGGDDVVNTRLPSPIAGAQTADGPPSAPTKQAFSPSHPLRVWVGGDSLAITPGQSLVNVSPGTQVVDVIDSEVDGHVATGLARPEVFNWPTHLNEVVARDNPNAIVLTIGSNDDQSLTGDGGVGPFGSDEWQTEYRRRVGGLMDAVTVDYLHVLFWVGVPVIRNLDRSRDHYQLINDIVRSEAAKRPGRVVYIDAYNLFTPPGGGYDDFLPDAGGAPERVRAPDGIHFTRAGGDRIANAVLDAMRDTFDLSSWQNAPSTTTTVGPTTTTRRR